MNVHWTDRAKARLKLLEVHIAQDSPQVARETVLGADR
jgi:plasmid stabilization system protein ParE